ncbi:MAG: pyridoxal phosphate-dependent aminotransferase [Myxococcota bacterium]
MATASLRGENAPSSPIRKLVPFADGARARGIEVFHLNIGQPDIETPAVMREALRSYGAEVIAYGPSGGDAPFREFLTSYYAGLGVDLAPSDLLVTTGGSEAVLFAFAACLDHGDEILVPDPMYANYMGYGTMLGNAVRPIPTRVEDGYHLPDALEDCITPRTKAILLCNPANPTGAVYSEDEVARIIAFACRHDLFVIADEVYREFVYDGPTARSVLTYPELGDRAVVVDSLSKRFSLCGARIGCLVSKHKGVMASAMKFAQARLSPPALAQIVATEARALPPGYFDAVKDEYRRRRDVVYESLQAIKGVVAHRPEGAFYQMARLPVDDSEAFVRFMLEDFSLDGQTTMVAPGGGFYTAEGRGTDEVRIAYVLNEADLTRSMQILAAGIEAYNAR